MECFYFGNGKSLYGCYHAPLPEKDRREGVLICNPIGQEHIRAHRTLKALADRLMHAGFHVMRFDYTGTGDSMDTVQSADVGQWLTDIAAAYQELADMSGAEMLSVIGVRLGATLAASMGVQQLRANRMIMIDPVVNGREYLRYVGKQHRDWLTSLDPLPPKQAFSNNTHVEYLGFLYAASLLSEIEQLELHSFASPHTVRVLVLNHAQLAVEVAPAQIPDNPIKTIYLTEKPFWQKDPAGNSGLVAMNLIEKICEWMVE